MNNPFVRLTNRREVVWSIGFISSVVGLFYCNSGDARPARLFGFGGLTSMTVIVLHVRFPHPLARWAIWLAWVASWGIFLYRTVPRFTF